VTVESELLAWLHEHLPSGPQLALGLGDDAAVLASLDEAQAVVTTDMLTDGVDFILSEIDPRQAGHKALGVNLSDLAAMAAQPVALFVSLVLPRQGCRKLTALQLATELYRGMMPLAEEFDAVIAGGDTNTWDGPLAISITAIGKTTEQGPLTRCGARVGDQLLVTGQLGGSILGRHLAVEPRVREALLLHERFQLHAGIDISDGLSLDASRLAAASGVGLLLDPTAIPISDAARRLSERDNRSPFEHAWGDGEDFELLLAVPTDVAETMIQEQPLDIPLTRIGEMIEAKGLWLETDDGPTSATPTGFQHRDDG
jgi:thiamine-monophosphate kinase